MVVMYFPSEGLNTAPWDHFQWKLYGIIDTLESISEAFLQKGQKSGRPGKLTPNLAWLSSLKSLWPVKITQMTDSLTSSREKLI